MLSDFVPNYSATVVENLTKRHGANVIGKVRKLPK
jgi:Asp-tRNA(Asn)/Glu-tRNA(Gln) amidotransferase A subunit family amidase